MLATKVAGSGRDYIRGGRDIDAAAIREAVDTSLTRLKTDYIDLYQIHWPNRGTYHFRGAWVSMPPVRTRSARSPKSPKSSIRWVNW